jgi:hypothetical protein
MVDIKQIYYIAGIWEGEGSFTKNNGTHKISLAMTDEDIVRRVRDAMQIDCRIYHYNTAGKKDIYSFQLLGSRAIQWMMTLYSLMGVRRREQIRNLLLGWKLKKRSSDSLCRHGHPFSIINQDFKYALNGVKVCSHCIRIKSKFGTLKAGLEILSNAKT